MHILYPHEVRQPQQIAPLDLVIDDDLERRDSWMFAPLAAIVVALPILMTAVVGFSVFHLNSQSALSTDAPATVIASRWPDQSLPVVR